VQYGKLGVPFQGYERWIHAGAKVPSTGLRVPQAFP